ncbi:hypothetical protein [Phenylobacterium sp.]|uniref:hypothetical protein n=1 Tax=Phenylobacterium sp. TaxID=1871053 RepID=UPI0035B2A27E
MTLRLAMFVTAAGLGLGACSTPLDAPLSPSFGVAAATLQSQAIPPAPDPGPRASSAARGVAAIRRYEAGEVKEAETQAASQLGASSLSTAIAPTP